MVRKARHRLTNTAKAPNNNRISKRNILVASTSTLAIAGLAVVGLPALTASAAPSSYVVSSQLVNDDFSRVTAGGWGSAPLGGAYKTTGTSAFSANGTSGSMALPRPGTSLTAALPSVTAADVTTAATIDVPRLPTSGNGIFAGVQTRVAGGSHYQANVRVNAAGAMTLTIIRVNGSTADQTTVGTETRVATGVKAGAAVRLEFQATGSNPVHLQARAWLAGQATPGWQVQADDSSAKRLMTAGTLAAWSYVSGSSAAQPVAFDSLTAAKLKLADPTTSPTPTPTTSPTQTPTTTPTPTPTPTQTTQPAPPATGPTPTAPAGDPSIDTSGTRFATGAAAIGTTSYAVPAGAVVVAPAGSDSAAGTASAPFRTVQHAIDAAPSGATIVLRAGNYHESLTVPGTKKLTIQSYPKEAAYLDGSSVVSGWTQSGSTWVAGGWNHVFDSSPTYDRGAPDGTSAGWQWLNPSYPMASHPDQVWIGSVAQRQVASRSQVQPGTFFYDTTAKALVLGTNPAGQQVRASDLQKAISVGSAGFTLKGVGVRRYAPSVPDMGAVTAYKGGALFENVAFTDNATTGVSLGGDGNTLRSVTAARNGLLGVHANYSDHLTLDHVLAAGNNAEHFNTSPVSGGVKITRSRIIDVRNSAFVRNQSHGLWMDESVYGMTIAHNDSIGNAGNGIVLEISATASLVDNVSSRNTSAGIKLNDISNAKVWNNTLTDNARNLDITQDSRRGNNPNDAGHDPRQAFPDPTMTWITGPTTIRNNIVSGGTGNCLLCVEDYSHTFSAETMHVTSDYNLYRRPSASAPTWAVIWSRGAGNPAVYTTFGAFTSASGQEAHSTIAENAPTLAPSQLLATVTSPGTGLPSDIAALAGKPAGTVHVGAW
ncbi:right-handed parallel beta-helix repeat-containing protein [Leifsonia xyli]|uniref:right-handed parallel beta-helix repeat-containing protein n=1 Tax=Leifsonia xyli TaxID=1575 RepID=UPI003D671A1F